MIKGVQYVTDMAGKPVAVQIDLRAHGLLWEEFCDVLVAKSRKKEPHAPWDDVKKRLAKKQKNQVTYIITVARSAEKELQYLSNPWAAKISKAIDALAQNPRPHGCKKLVGSKDIWRIRVADYRVIYAIDDVIRIVAIERIAHRKEAYD